MYIIKSVISDTLREMCEVTGFKVDAAPTL